MTASRAGFPLGGAITRAELAGDPHPLLARLRQHEPVSWLPALNGWLVTRRDLALQVMRDAATFTVDDPRFSTARVVGPSMLSLDGAAHARHRAPFAPGFSRPAVDASLGAFADAQADALVAWLRPAGAADLRRSLAGPLAVAVVARALGLDDAEPATVLSWYLGIVGAVSALTGQPGGDGADRSPPGPHPPGSTSPDRSAPTSPDRSAPTGPDRSASSGNTLDGSGAALRSFPAPGSSPASGSSPAPADAVRAGAEAFASLSASLRSALARNHESLLAHAASTSALADGQPGSSSGALTEDEVISNAAVLMFGGIETTEGMIANAVLHLLTHPAQLALVRQNPSLVRSAVDESLRLEPAAAFVDRYATADAQLGGADVRRGDLVSVSLAGAGRDPAVFSEPDTFDVRRPNAHQHLAFAHGPHFCLGVHLARLEAAAGVRAALTLPGLRLEPGAPSAPRGLVFRKPPELRVRWTPA
ncbi:MAG TPA: cytochrome P450 [Streptosporangiaceae bacterium]|jgi:cytochrome P450